MELIIGICYVIFFVLKKTTCMICVNCISISYNKSYWYMTNKWTIINCDEYVQLYKYIAIMYIDNRMLSIKP